MFVFFPALQRPGGGPEVIIGEGPACARRAGTLTPSVSMTWCFVENAKRGISLGLVPYDWLVVRQRGDEVIEEVIEEYDDGEDGCTLEDDVKDDERPARPCRPTLIG